MPNVDVGLVCLEAGEPADCLDQLRAGRERAGPEEGERPFAEDPPIVRPFGFLWNWSGLIRSVMART